MNSQTLPNGPEFDASDLGRFYRILDTFDRHAYLPPYKMDFRLLCWGANATPEGSIVRDSRQLRTILKNAQRLLDAGMKYDDLVPYSELLSDNVVVSQVLRSVESVKKVIAEMGKATADAVAKTVGQAGSDSAITMAKTMFMHDEIEQLVRGAMSSLQPALDALPEPPRPVPISPRPVRRKLKARQ